ncbi:hypothetical protein [Flavobacterium litorale]|uniref:Uncharacterized protein n=1 Tax=Flavobacterium litorale TaxID=2856519 RepID=A0ABX8V3J2_9FLAO|nr:hypothetical protein [Flavobacterium litorale]QYJ67387.1 hypothetical protein K1I41_07365 [Flavobacterium litorale]
MLRHLILITFVAIGASFLLTFFSRPYLAETVIVSATIAYAVLTVVTIFQAGFKFRAPFISEVILGGLLILLLSDGYKYAGAQPVVYYLFCASFVLRTITMKDEKLAHH